MRYLVVRQPDVVQEDPGVPEVLRAVMPGQVYGATLASIPYDMSVQLGGDPLAEGSDNTHLFIHVLVQAIGPDGLLAVAVYSCLVEQGGYDLVRTKAVSASCVDCAGQYVTVLDQAFRSLAGEQHFVALLFSLANILVPGALRELGQPYSFECFEDV
jgi:hypothetical protein